ncbi:hypothetical protein CRG98_029416 [Punica granatum]|uniref:Uncharacterized protein n=1 Tax=Punica granatum TaxID=22663 RepID=A0A2I0J1R0_PUNGR|nr:hypothetical protein CRG98_029416 [Punica granatum]
MALREGEHSQVTRFGRVHTGPDESTFGSVHGQRSKETPMTQSTRDPTPQAIDHGVQCPHALSVCDPNAIWGLVSSHNFNSSSIQMEDDLGRDVRKECDARNSYLYYSCNDPDRLARGPSVEQIESVYVHRDKLSVGAWSRSLASDSHHLIGIAKDDEVASNLSSLY